jgi:L-glyceraldehyde 3-phosphate reductase
MEETISALAQIVRQGKALYLGVSSFSPQRTRKAFELLDSEGVRLLIHQPSYSLLNRHIEDGLLATLNDLGVGCVAFSALAQGLLTNKYISRDAVSGRALDPHGTFPKHFLSEENLSNIRGLAAIAGKRGQTLPQMAIAWVLRESRVTSALIGARTVQQLDDSLGALKHMKFDAGELQDIDLYAKEGGIDLWRETSRL